MRYLTLLSGLLSLSLALASPTQTSANPLQTPSNNQNEHPGGDAGSAGIQEKIQRAIQQDSSLSDAKVNVTVNDNKVELNGTVASKQQKKAINQIAESNAGGLKVVDRLKVEKSANR